MSAPSPSTLRILLTVSPVIRFTSSCVLSAFRVSRLRSPFGVSVEAADPWSASGPARLATGPIACSTCVLARARGGFARERVDLLLGRAPVGAHDGLRVRSQADGLGAGGRGAYVVAACGG